MTAREDLRRQAEADGIEFFFAMFVDMHGKPCAKLVPAESFDLLMDGGAGFAGFAAGSMGQTPSDPDMIAVPDPSSYLRVPWQPELAVLQCDIHVDGQPWRFTPRVILKNQLARLEERGLTYKVGVEAEYFLVSRQPDGGVRVADPLDTASSPCYDVKALTRMYPHLVRVSNPWVAAVLAALLTTWVTFVPCFVFVFVGAPYVERLRGNRALSSALTGITASVVGVIANLAIFFAIHTLFRDVTSASWGPVHLQLPVLTTLKPVSLAIALTAATLLFRLKWSVLRTLGACALLGLAAGVVAGLAG